jgi:predicted nucleic acid-binding protein
MPERIVINTGPLVALARMGALEVAGRLPFDFVCPREVWAELEEGARQGHIPVAPEWLRVTALEAPLSPVAVAALDAGEAAVIQLALDLAISWVCMDEWKGRRAAASAGLKVVGALGLLGMAKTRGFIPALRPYVDKAAAAGVRYDAELVRQVLTAAGE